MTRNEAVACVIIDYLPMANPATAAEIADRIISTLDVFDENTMRQALAGSVVSWPRASERGTAVCAKSYE